MPPAPLHPFAALVAAVLGPARRAGEADYLVLLDRRLRALEEAAGGRMPTRSALGLGRGDRARSRRVLRRHEGRWHDGDENLVRGWLDKWRGAGDSPAVLARRLTATAGALVHIRPRAATLWFFLWEMESMLPDVLARPGSGED
ncbi:MAG TPA: hypothetical protein VMR21_10825 [Vicinamibacteria bacterium]|nr:hypothetical protein [Vicinamibacteria bacterium]